ncbi:MAG: hypothetical protein JWN13_4192 [Betaproteobacteria bacterium]|jgi:hypothetical protein|nr:hypothetical protein [Betaproteobacteria bacterium]
MLKIKLASVVITGLCLSAGAVQAASVFPSSTNEVSPSGYAMSIEGPTEARMGAMQPIFPSAAIEHGMLRESYADARRVRPSPSIAGARSIFPISVSETGRL